MDYVLVFFLFFFAEWFVEVLTRSFDTYHNYRVICIRLLYCALSGATLIVFADLYLGLTAVVATISAFITSGTLTRFVGYNK